MLSIVFLFLSVSCSTNTITVAQNCDVRLQELSREVASPEDTVSATGGPMTMVWDTVVYVGDYRAETVSLQREGCEECDECRNENQCSACDDCDECDVLCADTCIEMVEFRVPDLSAGAYPVSFYNGHGQSNAVSLDVNAAANAEERQDTGNTGDTGTSVDTGTP